MMQKVIPRDQTMFNQTHSAKFQKMFERLNDVHSFKRFAFFFIVRLYALCAGKKE